jgi:hypothetical protein
VLNLDVQLDAYRRANRSCERARFDSGQQADHIIQSTATNERPDHRIATRWNVRVNVDKAMLAAGK